MMTVVVYNIVKAPMGWAVFCDGAKLGGICGSKEAALEATPSPQHSSSAMAEGCR
jgi:hypothetical protein